MTARQGKHARILLEYYDFDSIPEIEGALRLARLSGADIHITRDHLPSAIRHEKRIAAQQMFERLQAIGVDVDASKRYKDMLPVIRNHRKIAVFERDDELLAMSGGINLTEKNFNLHDYGFVYTGEVAQILREVAIANGDREKLAWKQKQFGNPFEGAVLLNDENIDVAVSTIQSTVGAITITSPFLGRRIKEALKEAAFPKPGKERRSVSVILSQYPLFSFDYLAPKYVRMKLRGKSNEEIQREMVKDQAEELTGSGIQVYIYPGTSHAKGMVIGHEFALSTTHNFSRRLDAGLNLEVGICSINPQFVFLLSDWMENTKRASILYSMRGNSRRIVN